MRRSVRAGARWCADVCSSRWSSAIRARKARGSSAFARSIVVDIFVLSWPRSMSASVAGGRGLALAFGVAPESNVARRRNLEVGEIQHAREPLVHDQVGDELAAGALERHVAVAAAEDRDRQAGALPVCRRAEPPPRAHRIDDDERELRCGHLLGHDGGRVALARAPRGEEAEGFGDGLCGRDELGGQTKPGFRHAMPRRGDGRLWRPPCSAPDRCQPGQS